jgi:hypothetical protein
MRKEQIWPVGLEREGAHHLAMAEAVCPFAVAVVFSGIHCGEDGALDKINPNLK